MVDPAASMDAQAQQIPTVADGDVAAGGDVAADGAAQGGEKKSSAESEAAAKKNDENPAGDAGSGADEEAAAQQNQQNQQNRQTGSVAQARDLFNSASAGSKDGCIAGADAEDILHKLGATSIGGMPMVSV